MTEFVPRPSGAGRVALDLGADIGALVLEAPAELAGREIEISPASGGPGARRTHSLVRERLTSAGRSYAAVYPGLRAEDYIIWRDAVTPVAVVAVSGGQVTRYRWGSHSGGNRPDWGRRPANPIVLPGSAAKPATGSARRQTWSATPGGPGRSRSG